jgi:hypothetical protein
VGLISLPIANRAGVYTYWNNVWNKSINFTMYLFSDFFISSFLFLFFNDLTFTYLYTFFKNKLKSYKKGYVRYTKQIKYRLRFLNLGRIWFFMYQSWVIIKVAIFAPFKERHRELPKNISLLKLYKIFNFKMKKLKFFNYYAYLNYKYKV